VHNAHDIVHVCGFREDFFVTWLNCVYGELRQSDRYIHIDEYIYTWSSDDLTISRDKVESLDILLHSSILITVCV